MSAKQSPIPICQTYQVNDTAGLRLLLSPEGQELLASLPPYDPSRLLALTAELRKDYDADLVAAALTQQQLRERARAKLGEFAGSLLYTEAGLQQATRLQVAAHHAQRYRGAVERVFDLGCGLGIDSLAFAGLGLEVVAADSDETTAALAMLNLRPFPNAKVLHADAFTVAREAGPEDGIYADPARRTATGRVFDPNAYSPPLADLLALRKRTPALGLKLAPGISYDFLPADAHAQWVSVDGSVVEAGLWFGPLAVGPGRSALVIKGQTAAVMEVTTDPREPGELAEIGPLRRYLLEPDGAVIRAGGVAKLAREAGAVSLSDGIAYLTADEPYAGPFGESFEVLGSFPYSKPRLAAWCSRHEIGTLEIKKRGVDVVPDELRKSLKLRGSSAATVVLTRVLGKHTVIVVRRLAAG